MDDLTLTTQRLYFGVDALRLRTAAGRVLARVMGLPPERASVSARALQRDFGVDTVVGRALVDELVAEGMLRPRNEHPGRYRPTERFLELAAARVVDALPRTRAKLLVDQAGELAARINAGWTRNPVEIEAVVPFGSYMSRDDFLDDLPLGVVVRPRPLRQRLMSLRRRQTRSEGIDEIRAAFRELSSFVRVGIVNDLRLLPRPFTIAYHA
jgi:hypothetical protein